MHPSAADQPVAGLSGDRLALTLTLTLTLTQDSMAIDSPTSFCSYSPPEALDANLPPVKLAALPSCCFTAPSMPPSTPPSGRTVAVGACGLGRGAESVAGANGGGLGARSAPGGASAGGGGLGGCRPAGH